MQDVGETRRFALSIIVALALLGGALAGAPRPVAADAAEWTVCASGCDFDSIQAAIDAAADGDSIKIATGTYTIASGAAQVAAITKSLTLRGGYSADFAEWDPTAFPTVLNAEGSGRVVYISGAITVGLDGLQLLNGYHPSAGAGVYVNGAELHLSSCQVAGSRVPTGDGIGIYQNGGLLEMQDCLVTDNVPTGKDDTTHMGGGLYALNATVTISDSTFSNNRAANPRYDSARGGGAALYGCTSVVQRVIFTGNYAGASNYYEHGIGGGLLVGNGTISLLDSTFTNNAGTDVGGGNCGGAGITANNAIISGNTFEGNDSSDWGGGGGLCITGQDVLVTGNTFRNNTGRDGAGMVATNAVEMTISDNEFIGNSNTGLSITTQAGVGGATAVTVSDNLFEDNTTTGNGGGLWITGAVDVLHNTFIGNQATGYGGGVYQTETSRNDNATAVYDGNLLIGNAASEGGGLYLRPEYSANLVISYRNMALLDNTATSKGSAILFRRFANDITAFDHLTLANNTGGDGSMIYNVMGDSTYTNCIMADAAIGMFRNSDSIIYDHVLRYNVTTPFSSNNALSFTDISPVEGDPAFAADGYHLTRRSAAVDAGAATALITDIDGDARPLGNAPDIGADESPYAHSDSAVQASLLAAEPVWRVYYNGTNVPPSSYLEQRYMIPYGYYAADDASPIATYAITDEWPADLELTESDSLLPLDFAQDEQQLTWTSLAPLAAGGWGWVSLTGTSETVPGGAQVVSSGQLDYALANGETGAIPFEATVDVPERPVYSPILYTPLDGEICIDDAGQLSAEGVAGAGMEVRLYEDGALKATTLADAYGQFAINWTTGLTEDHDVTIYATACDPGTDNCSAPSRSVGLEYPEANWCPQRSYWEGDAGGTHHVFYFRNDQGRYATNDFVIPGVYGFWNTQLHLFSCCEENDDNPFIVKADGVEYTSPSAHDGRWWTFNIGAAHQVTVESQCYSKGVKIGEPKEITGEVLIDPDGFIFDVNAGGAYDAVTGMYVPQQPLPGMTVSCYEWVPEWDSWILWPAEQYHQVNPQVTGDNGYFSFFTPPGQYYLQVDAADGYQSWRSPVVTVVSEIVHVNVPLTPTLTTQHSQVLLTPSGPDPEILYVPLNATVTWLAALDDEASAQDLADQMLTPTLRPYSLSPLDALSDTLGFDGGMLVPGQTYTRRFVGPGDYAYDDGLGHTGIIRVLKSVWAPVAMRPE